MAMHIYDLGWMLAQVLLLLCSAPLVAGIIKKVKALLQNRIGSSIFQEYFDLYKWWQKPTILTPYTSLVFIIAPLVYFASVVVAAAMLPNFFGTQFSFGDVFVFIGVLTLGRFFMTLSSLDTATAFGGMGGSREIYISVLAEPVILLAVLVNALRSGSTTLAGMALDFQAVYLSVASVLTCIAFFCLLLAENGRIPVDNPDTHLELTMIHECMLLEYSGRLLAVIHWASMLKTLVFLVLFSLLYLPLSLPLAVKVLFAVRRGMMNFLVIVLLFVVFLQTRIMDLRRAIICLSVQSAVIALACFISGIAHGEGIHIYAPGLLTIIVKVLLVPYAMLRLVSKLADERELISEINVNYSTAASAVFLVLSYLIVDKMLPGVEGRDILALSIVMILTGLTLIVMRSRAIMQMVGLITMENGIYLLGMAMTEGLPLVIEMGIFLDVLIAVMVLVILTNRLRLSFMTTDTNVLRKLKG